MSDVAAQAGLTLLNVHGDGSGDYILDTNGNGAGFFDFDNDGDLDALIVNGSTREHLAREATGWRALYRGDGHRRFTDVTASSGWRRAARAWAPASPTSTTTDSTMCTLRRTFNVLCRTPDDDGPRFRDITQRPA